MKAPAGIIAVAVLLCAGVLVAAPSKGLQEDDQNPVVGARTEAEKAPGEPADAAKIDELVRALGDKEFKRREEACRELKAIGEAARPQLKKALESGDPEVRWRASRLLYMLDEKGVARLEDQVELRPVPENGGGWDEFSGAFKHDLEGGLADHLNGLFHRLFSDSFTPLQFRFFDDALDIDKILEDFKRHTGQLSIELGDSATSYRFERKDNESATEFSLAIDGGGAVTATVTRTGADGKEEKSTYAAESLEEFKAKYPDVAKEFQLDGFRVSIHLPDMLGSRHQGLGLRLDRAPFGFDRKFHRKVLGVYTQDAGAPLRAQLGLGEHEGLVVSGTAGESFARRIGIEPMDVIVSVNGRTVGAPDDIREALLPVEDAEPVSVEVIRKGKRLELKGEYSLK